ncbi:hypothetical protein AB9K41_02125 [Cribrihabitans sp. XS_ASV171]
MSNVTKLPSAATSYYTVHKAGCYFDVVLITPCSDKAIKTRLYRFADRAAAVAHGKATADRMQRPFKSKGGEA